MEHRVAEDRVRVVVEAHEARQIEPVRVVHAQDEPVEQRVQEERGEDRQRGDEEQEVDRAFATPAAEPGSVGPDRVMCGPWQSAWGRASPGVRRSLEHCNQVAGSDVSNHT